MTIAHLGLAVDSGPVEQAVPDLNRLTAAAGQAEVAAVGQLGALLAEGDEGFTHGRAR